MRIGLGTGSTMELAIVELGQRVQAGLEIITVPSSKRTAESARARGITIDSFSNITRLDLAIDSADEVDPQWNLIKGGGGALVRERIVISSASTVVILVDASKLVTQLGQFSLPLEVVPFAWQQVTRYLERIGRPARLRGSSVQPFSTDNGNYILDCTPQPIPDPEALYKQLKRLPGIVDVGIFYGMVDVLVVGFEDHAEVRRAPNGGKKTAFRYI